MQLTSASRFASARLTEQTAGSRVRLRAPALAADPECSADRKREASARSDLHLDGRIPIRLRIPPRSLTFALRVQQRRFGRLTGTVQDGPGGIPEEGRIRGWFRAKRVFLTKQ